MSYTIGEFSKITSLSTYTLRYYETEKLIIVGRDAGGRRCYSQEDINWIFFIKRLKETGMPIKDIKKYAYLRYKGDSTVIERLHMLEKHRLFALEEKEKWQTNLANLEEKIKVYKEMIMTYALLPGKPQS